MFPLLLPQAWAGLGGFHDTCRTQSTVPQGAEPTPTHRKEKSSLGIPGGQRLDKRQRLTLSRALGSSLLAGQTPRTPVTNCKGEGLAPGVPSCQRKGHALHREEQEGRELEITEMPNPTGRMDKCGHIHMTEYQGAMKNSTMNTHGFSNENKLC